MNRLDQALFQRRPREGVRIVTPVATRPLAGSADAERLRQAELRRARKIANQARGMS